MLAVIEVVRNANKLETNSEVEVGEENALWTEAYVQLTITK